MIDLAEIVRRLTKAQRRNLLCLTEQWQTLSEMRHKGATGSGMDILYVMHDGASRLCNRQWTRWGDEPGQKRGEGYQYRLTRLGIELRNHLRSEQS